MKVILDIYNERMGFGLVSKPFEWIFPKYPKKNDMIIPLQFIGITSFEMYECDGITDDYHFYKNCEFNIVDGEPVMTLLFYDNIKL